MSSKTLHLRLFHYWRSSTSWRVRFALAAKGIEAEMVAVDLLQNASEDPGHLLRNPMGYVPVLEFLETPPGQPRFIAESLAILEWAEEAYPTHPLLPSRLADRARVRQLTETINAGTQPLVNFGVAAFHSSDENEQLSWNQHWLRKGFGAYEELVKETAGRYSMGNSLSLADICLIPQLYSARRSKVDLAEFPTLTQIEKAVLEHPACKASHPDQFAPK